MRLNKLLTITVLAMLLAACGAAESTTEPTTEAAAGAQRALPRERVTSASDVAMGEGTDICGEFPEADPLIFTVAEDDPLFVGENEYVIGVDQAAVTFILYGNLADSGTADTISVLQEVLEAHQGEPIRVVFRHFADDADQAAMLAAEALESTAQQAGNDGFWAMIDALAENRTEWVTTSGDELVDLLADYAAEAGADREVVASDLLARTHLATIEEANTLARMLGGSVPPLLVINDVPLGRMPEGFEEANLLTQIFLLKQKYPNPPPMVIDPDKDYGAWIVTEKGTIALDLFADLAPETVNNLAYLACSGYYDGVTFHRVLPGFMAQAGDPTGTGVGGPGYTINDEFFGSGLRFDREGLLSMAHTSQPNSAGSQFFITLGPAPHLDGAFTIFGEVVSGMEVVKAITPRDPERNPTGPGDVMETVVVQELP